jgi:hypothetical protein
MGYRSWNYCINVTEVVAAAKAGGQRYNMRIWATLLMRFKARTRPHLSRDWAHPSHICAGTGLTPATSATGLGPPLPHRRMRIKAVAALSRPLPRLLARGPARRRGVACRRTFVSVPAAWLRGAWLHVLRAVLCRSLRS